MDLIWQVIESIQKILTCFQEVEMGVLYGSRANGNYRNGSDIDLTLKGELLNLTILNAISNQLEDLLLPYTFDLSIFHQISNADLIDHIQRVGVILYNKSKYTSI
jgi:predicted nucleotidyltransferase